MTSMHYFVALAVAAIAAGTVAPCSGADARRQAEVATRGGDVMPFSLAATTHVFAKTAHGGIQRVVVKDAADTGQIRLIRRHLHDMSARFQRGDFSGPAHIHGADMPGLAELRSAGPGQLVVRYRDVPGGAELSYRSADRRLVHAVHRWFDAQLADHGPDAVAGHAHHHAGMMPPR